MTETEQIIAIAELDGFKFTGGDGFIKDGLFYTVDGQAEDFECIGIGGEFIPALPDYLHSLDAIIPVIDKSWNDKKFETHDFYRALRDYHPGITLLFIPAPQLCEALLRATGKWKE